MTKHRTTRLWSRTTKVLGKFFAEMVSSYDRHPNTSRGDDIYPRFPIF
jgi:hypothetical protein